MANELGNMLKKKRESLGLSLREASRRTNGKISHSFISAIEKGVNTHGKPFTPTPDALEELAKVYDLNFLSLMSKAGYLGSMKLSGKPKITVEGSEKMFADATEPVPVYGIVHAGEAKFADQDIIGKVSVSPSFVRKYGHENLFALQITGDSMNRRIPNGFAAVFSKDCEIDNGDVVAVLIDHEDATVKRYRKTSTAVVFEPDSYDPTYQPYVFQSNQVQDYKILGKYLFSTDIAI